MHGNRAASREFDGVNESNVRLWRRQKERFMKMPHNKKANPGGSAAHSNLNVNVNVLTHLLSAF